jgi:hypothetical protein
MNQHLIIKTKCYKVINQHVYGLQLCLPQCHGAIAIHAITS